MTGRSIRARLLSGLRLSTGLAPRPGVRRPDPLSSYSQAFSTDEKASIWVDYSADPTPLVNRIVDEIREVDGARCRGLFIGRAHFLQDEGKNEWSYLFYFGLDFGGRDGACDLSAAL